MLPIKKKQYLTEQTRKEFLAIKRIRPNRARIKGRMTDNVMPPEVIQKNPEAFFEGLTQKELALINLIVEFRRKYEVVNPTHHYISEQLDCTVQHVQNMINRLEACGIMTVVYRHYRSSLFRLSNWLKLPDVVDRVQQFIPGIRSLALAFLLLLPAASSLRALPEIFLLQQIKDQDMLFNINKSSLRKAYENPFSIQKISDESPEQHDFTYPKSRFLRHKEKNPLKRDSQSGMYNEHVYGGTGLYDRPTTQKELELMQKIRDRQRKVYGMDDSIKHDKEAQPRFNEKKVNYSSHVSFSPYKPYVHEERIAEDPVDACAKLSNWTNSPEYKQFVALFGQDVADKMCQSIVNKAIEER